MDSSESLERHPFELLADEFVSKVRAGQSPSIDEYAQQYPEHAAVIRSVFPSLLVVEKISAKDSTVSYASTSRQDDRFSRQQLPSQFDDYQIVRCIGQGGMGVVYEAIQESLHRKVALKVIHPQASSSSHSRARFQREAESAAGLHHTNIVPVYGSGEDHGLLYYAMQLIHGSTLAQIVQSLQNRLGGPSEINYACSEQTIHAVDRLMSPKPVGFFTELKGSNNYASQNTQGDDLQTRLLATRELTLSPTKSLPNDLVREDCRSSDPSDSETSAGSLEGISNESSPSAKSSLEQLPRHYYRNICRLVAKVANALDYAHESGVLHRDIKPSNLLLDQTGTIWVADFGLARREDLDGQTQTGELLGTLRYMAPEQFSGKSDARSDIYSLGLTLFELLTLRPALDSPKRRLLDPAKYSQLEWTAAEREKVPKDLQTILRKAVAYEPEKRYQRARDLQEDLERFLDDRPILARRESMLESLTRWARRNPAIATLTATLFGLLLTIASILGLWNRQQRLTLDELKTAYQTSAKNLIERTQALEQAETESNRAKQNMELAIEAFSTIAENISARGRSLEIQGFEDQDVESIGFSDAVLTQADVELLKSLQIFFDRFAQENAADLRLDAAVARRRVGEIESKIGKYDQAVSSLKRSINQFVAIRGNQTADSDLGKILEEEFKAREQLVAIYSRRDQYARAQEEMSELRDVLKNHSAFAQSNQGKYALASALGCLSSGSLRIANERSNNDRRRRALPPFANRAAAFGVDMPTPMAQRLQRDLTHIVEAISLMDELCNAEPQNSQHRLVLARNQTDRMRLCRLLGDPSGFEDSLKKASEILEDLLKKSPESYVLKYDLANLYSSSLLHPSVDGNRLEEALRIIKEVLQDHPSVPEYQTLYASLLARSAWGQPFATETQNERQFERVENGISKLQQAIAIHQGLAERFPDIAMYEINLLQTKVQLVDYNLQFRRPEKAKQALADAIALAEKMIASGTSRPPVVRMILERLRERKTSLENRTEPEKP